MMYHYHGEDFDHAVIVIHSENYIYPPPKAPQAHIAHIVVDDTDDSSDDIIDMNYMTSEEPEVVNDKVLTPMTTCNMQKYIASSTTRFLFRNYRTLMLLLLVICFFKQIIVVEADFPLSYPDVDPTSDAILLFRYHEHSAKLKCTHDPLATGEGQCSSA